jgi:hypothetical protein
MASPKKPHYDETDVDKVIAKEDTGDGPGFDIDSTEERDLPESDFVSFAEDGVEEEDDEEGPQ